MKFRLLVTHVLNFETLLLGVEVDELLREGAAERERGLLQSLGIAR